MSLTILNQIKCSLTKHKVPIEDEDVLFDANQDMIETECEECHTPLILERMSRNDDFYFISEYVEN